MAYTPELTQQHSCMLRRIAWALGVPMTIAMEKVFEHIPMIVEHRKICEACKDKSRCSECEFNGDKEYECKRT